MKRDDEFDREIKQKLRALPLERKLEFYAVLLYLAWLDGSGGENLTAYEIARGAWLHYLTFPLRKLRADLMRDEHMRIAICGVLTAVFYALIVARSLGAR